MNSPQLLPFRVGQGFDIHALVPGRPLVLGGVEIKHRMGLLGHSDADALFHAITDAILGAAALGDIGSLFPDDDPKFKGADSALLLRESLARARSKGWQLVNVDSTVIAQAPRLSPHVAQMRVNIASACSIAVEQVNVKAKTAERLGSLGRQEGISAQAVVLLSAVQA
ncbi:MAG: 2-C-methyl-D-erythritol 2,4-cyclodiphosphate synthase [Burkholderiaceae bacterium]